MNIARLNQLLEEQLVDLTPESVEGASVWRLPQPIGLAPLLDQSLDTEEEIDEYQGSFESWPGSVEEVLDRQQLQRPLISLYWDGFGPISWMAGIVSLETAGRSWISIWDEANSYRLTAVIAPAGAAVALRTLVTETIATGLVVLSVISDTTNHIPEVVSRADLEDAYAQLVDLTGGWGTLAEEHFSRMIEPNHLERSLDMIRRLPPHQDADAVAAWLEEQKGSDIPTDARRQLLHEFLETGYEEASGVSWLSNGPSSAD